MKRFLMRIVIALIAFAAGVTAATVFGGLLGLNSKRECRRPVQVAVAPVVRELHFEAPALPEPPLPPVAPVPPVAPLPPDAEKEMRMSIRLPDGTVRIIELKGGHIQEK
jgi:hypothetical protein